MKRILPVLSLVAFLAMGAQAFACYGPFPPVYDAPPYIDPDYRPLTDYVSYSPKTKFVLLMKDDAPSFEGHLDFGFKFDWTREDGSWDRAGFIDRVLQRYRDEIAGLLKSKNIEDKSLELFKKDDGWDRGCSRSMIDRYASFLRAVFADPAVTGGYDLFVDARQKIPAVCKSPRASTAAEDLAALKKMPGTGLYPLYLEATQALYKKDFDKALKGFRELAARQRPSSWLHQAALYMIARTELVAAQAPWDGYRREGVDQQRLSAAKRDFEAYVAQYPSGLYAKSARGIQRKIMFLADDQASLDDAVAAYFNNVFADFPPSSEAAIRRSAEAFAEYKNFHKGAPSPEKDSLFALAYKLFRSKEGVPEEWWSAAADALQKREDRATRPALFRFVQAYLLFRQKEYDALLKRTPPEETLQNTVLSLSTEVLRARALAGKNDIPAAIAAWRRIASVAHDDQSQLQIAALYANDGDFAGLFGKDSGITNPNVLADFAVFATTEDDLRSVLRDVELAEPTRTALEQALFQKLLLRRDYASMADLYKKAKGPKGYASIRAAVETLAHDPNDPASLVAVATYMYYHALMPKSSTYRDLSLTDSDALAELSLACVPCRRYLENNASFVPPIQNFLDAAAFFERTGERSDVEAEALHRLIECTEGVERKWMCQWYTESDSSQTKRRTANQGEKWFRRLHKRYPSSPWTAKTPHYYP
ncbi:MAG: hypothetical protein PHS57_01195 [Alphaproteobacteria bacterium]|nr:hypothetical protein [Alphaproteobacteria bacterium]